MTSPRMSCQNLPPRLSTLRRAVLMTVLAAASAPAFAGSIITNLDTGNPSQGSFVGTDVYRAAGFTIADGFSYSLESITLILSVSEAGPSGFAFSIYSGNINQPISLLASLTTSQPVTTSAQSHTFTPVTPVTLGGNTTYWLVLKGTLPFDTTKSVWWEAPGSGFTLADGVTFAREDYTINSGATWLEDAGPVHFAFQVNAVPEPGTAALLGGSALAFLLLRRRARNC